jgi:hypothetical protein
MNANTAFLWETWGAKVVALENSRTNYNQMRGIRWLRESLQSSIDIVDVDLDGRFTLPTFDFGLIVFFGTLYHLKNLYYALERFAAAGRHLILSTRVTRFAPCVPPDLSQNPLAYLLTEDELNQDDTNFWIFTEAGLRRLLHRSGRDILAFSTFGSSASDPSSLQADERAFCLAESRMTRDLDAVQLTVGWHDIEPSGWRWTEGRFEIQLYSSVPGRLRLAVVVHPDRISRQAPIHVVAVQGESTLVSHSYQTPGAYSINIAITRVDLPHTTVLFQVSSAIKPSLMDARELALIVTSVTFEGL